MLAAAPDLSVVDSFDELFAEAIDALRNATAALAGVGAAIGCAEPVRRRLDAQTGGDRRRPRRARPDPRRRARGVALTEGQERAGTFRRPEGTRNLAAQCSRNSWGTGWGDRGFAYASLGYAQEAFTAAYGIEP